MLETIGTWFTPTILFCLMNLMIATIFLSYKKPVPEPDPTRNPSIIQRARSTNFNFNFNLYNPDQNPTHLLSRAPSLLYERVRSFNFSLSSNSVPRDENPTHNPNQGPALVEQVSSVNLSPNSEPRDENPTHNPNQAPPPPKRVPNSITRNESPTQLAKTTLTMLDRLWGNASARKPDPDSKQARSNDPKSSLRRTESEEIHTQKPDLVVRMRKSASEKMVVEEEDEVELRRPETVRERERALEEEEEGEEVDDKADDFIYKFREQLKLQRLGSLLRFNEMLQRGA